MPAAPHPTLASAPAPDAPSEPNRFRVGPLVAALNYCTLDVEWRASAPRLTLRVHDAAGAVRLAHTFTAGSAAASSVGR